MIVRELFVRECPVTNSDVNEATRYKTKARHSKVKAKAKAKANDFGFKAKAKKT